MKAATRRKPASGTPPGPAGTASAAERRGRPAAGQDPAKRAQILAGAERVFNSMGFDAASMNDITREAGVSKATIYVYFSGKEELFAELFEQKRQRHRDELMEAFQSHPEVEEALTHLGRCLAAKLTSNWAVDAQRVVLGVTSRMPEIGQRFYDGGPKVALERLEDFLCRKTEAGELSVPDPELAARQFIDLCVSGLLRPRLYAVAAKPPSDTEIARVVESGVSLFLNTYGPAR